MKHNINHSVSSLSHDSEEKAKNKKCMTIFKWVFFFFFIYALPIIFADVLYQDDIQRVLYGDPSSWYKDGRPLMAYILTSLSFGIPLFDIFPAPLLLGLLFLSFALTLFYKKYLHSYDTISVILCLLMLIISPFFLENLSFRFESLVMCISLGLFIILFSLSEHTAKLVCFLQSFVITILVSSTYQASVGAFFSLLFLTVFIQLKDVPLKQIIENASYKVIGFCVGAIFYMLCIAPNFVAKHGYQAIHSKIIPLNAEGFTTLLNNLKKFFSFLRFMYFPDSKSFITYLSALTIIFTLIAIAIYIKDILSMEQDNSKNIKASLAIISPVLIIFFAFLPMCFLSVPIFMPRTFISFNIFLLFLGSVFISLSKRSRLVLIIFIPIFFFSYSFSYTYANLLKSQAAYEAFVAQSIVQDLNKISGIDSSYRFYIEGKKVMAKDVILAAKRHGLFYLLIPVHLRKRDTFSGDLLSHYSTYKISTYSLEKYNPKYLKEVTKNSLYRIMQYKKNIVIEFL